MFQNKIENLQAIADQLISYNYPQADAKLENIINLLKIKKITVDGYDVIVHFNRSDYNSHYIESVQIFGQKTTFLPFDLVVKIGKKFLGSHHLALVEILNSDKKIYCWTVHLDKRGRPINPYKEDEDVEIQYHDGFKYYYLNPNQVNFY